MPKRRVKEEKPRKRMTRKQILIPPLIVGVATLGGLVIMHFLLPPHLSMCALRLMMLTRLMCIPE